MNVNQVISWRLLRQPILPGTEPFSSWRRASIQPYLVSSVRSVLSVSSDADLSNLLDITAILPNNHRGYYKRATSTALQLAIANCAGFIATFAYTSDQAATHYRKGHSVVLGFSCFAFVCLGLNLLYCKWENKARLEGRRDGNVGRWEELRAQGKTKAPIGDRAPTFLFTY